MQTESRTHLDAWKKQCVAMHNIGFEADPEIRDPVTEDPETATSRTRKNEGKTIFNIFTLFKISQGNRNELFYR